MTSPGFGLRFDLRRAPFSPVSQAELYRECVAMARWADARGCTAISVSEHHGVDFVSAPVALAGVLLGATRETRVEVSALLITLHDPVRLAESIATLDLASGGRFSIVAGLGYRGAEFAMAGVDRATRGRLADEHLDVLLRAFSGEEFEWRGRRVRVTPAPGALDDLTAEHLRASGAWRVVTPEQCVALVRDEGPVKLHPLVAGIPFALGWSSLELFVEQVLPRVS